MQKHYDGYAPLGKFIFSMLKDDIAKHGQKQPATAWRGLLLDGAARQQICLELKIPFNVNHVDYLTEEGADKLATKLNGRRRETC